MGILQYLRNVAGDEMTELTPKQVLENFTGRPDALLLMLENQRIQIQCANCEAHFEALLNLIREALKAAESVPLCSQYEVVKPLLEQALADYGERDE